MCWLICTYSCEEQICIATNIQNLATKWLNHWFRCRLALVLAVKGGCFHLRIKFIADTALDRDVTKITTHPDEREQWDVIREALHSTEKKMTVINAKNGRHVQVMLSSIAVIETEDRLCSVRLISGDRYLVNKRLKYVQESLESTRFIKINNRTIINLNFIREFSSTDHARIKVILTDDSSYYVNRYYIQQFRRSYHGSTT